MKKRACGVIRDGSNRAAYIEGVETMFEPLRFTYRPLTNEESANYQAKADKIEATDKSPEAAGRAAQVYQRMMCDRIVSWDLLEFDENNESDPGTPVDPKDYENIRRVVRRLQARIINIILGVSPSDVDPLWSEQAKREAERLRQRAREEGRTYGGVANEDDLKN